MNLKSPLWRRCYLHLRWYFRDLPQPRWGWMPGESESPSEASHPGDSPLCRFVLEDIIHWDIWISDISCWQSLCHYSRSSIILWVSYWKEGILTNHVLKGVVLDGVDDWAGDHWGVAGDDVKQRLQPTFGHLTTFETLRIFHSLLLLHFQSILKFNQVFN